MSYHMPSGASQGASFFRDNMSNSQFHGQFQPQEDYIMDNQNSWLDPALRGGNQNHDSQMNWQSQAKPIQRFMIEPERNFFTAGPFQHHPQELALSLNRPTAPISTIPLAPPHQRMVSPSPSHDPTSSCSSARSPGPDTEWYQDTRYSPQMQARDDYALPNATSFLGQGFPNSWIGQSQSHPLPQVSSYSCVKMSQVQTFPGPQEVTIDADEGYTEIEMKAEYALVSGTQHMKTEDSHHSHNNFRCPIDEGLGASIKDESSPRETGFNHAEDITSDVDAEGDADIDPDTIITEAASDTEYTPKSTRTRKRRLSSNTKAPSYLAIKRGRVVKPATNSKNKGHFPCKSCSHTPFKDALSLQRHIATAHTRAFICVFGFAGCPATFASKNEWKRHVSTQHLSLNAWVCDLGACGKNSTSSNGNSGKGVTKGSEFNRKDLFTQHLRRMHAPFSVKRQNKKNAEWEEKLKDLQRTCLITKRHPPTRLFCPVKECGTTFEGVTCWDDRMEHVGKHLEKAAHEGGEGVEGKVDQENDGCLLGWAQGERIIERRPGGNGGWRLCVGGGKTAESPVVDEDEDAEGEIE